MHSNQDPNPQVLGIPPDPILLMMNLLPITYTLIKWVCLQSGQFWKRTHQATTHHLSSQRDIQSVVIPPNGTLLALIMTTSLSPFFGDLGRSFSSPWQNLSDSDSSSSSSSPSPLYTRLSRNMESGTDDRSFWERIPRERSNWEGKSTDPVFYSDDQSKQYRKSSSCRETNSGRLGSSNRSFSRSTRERTDWAFYLNVFSFFFGG